MCETSMMETMILVLLSLWCSVLNYLTHLKLRYPLTRFEVDHLTFIDDVGNLPRVVLKGVDGKASLENGEQHDIRYADIELAFTSNNAASSCLSSVKALQRHLFLCYLQSQRLEEVVQFRR